MTDREKLNMLLEAIDYSFWNLQTQDYDKELTYPVIDKVKYIRKLLKEEPTTSIFHDGSEIPERELNKGVDILMIRKAEKDTNYPPIAGYFCGTNARADGKNWGYYNGFCNNEIEIPHK